MHIDSSPVVRHDQRKHYSTVYVVYIKIHTGLDEYEVYGEYQLYINLGTRRRHPSSLDCIR